jgi:hypothetical protein
VGGKEDGRKKGERHVTHAAGGETQLGVTGPATCVDSDSLALALLRSDASIPPPHPLAGVLGYDP